MPNFNQNNPNYWMFFQNVSDFAIALVTIAMYGSLQILNENRCVACAGLFGRFYGTKVAIFYWYYHYHFMARCLNFVERDFPARNRHTAKTKNERQFCQKQTGL